MKKLRWLLYLFVLLVFALFSGTLYLRNEGSVVVNYYFGISFEAHLVWLIMLPFFIGAFTGACLMWVSILKHKRRISVSNRKLAKVEKEVENLRAMPLKDEV